MFKILHVWISTDIRQWVNYWEEAKQAIVKDGQRANYMYIRSVDPHELSRLQLRSPITDCSHGWHMFHIVTVHWPLISRQLSCEVNGVLDNSMGSFFIVSPWRFQSSVCLLYCLKYLCIIKTTSAVTQWFYWYSHVHVYIHLNKYYRPNLGCFTLKIHNCLNAYRSR